MNYQELYEKVLKLDEEALSAFYDMFAPALYKYALRSSHVQTVADNVVSAVFGELLEEIANGTAPTENIRVYLYKSAYQLLLNHAQANPQIAFNEITLLRDEDRQSTSTASQTDEQVMMQTLISTLNTELTYVQRHVIVLRFLEDFSLKETSEIIGEEVNNAKIIQNAAIRKLRKAMGLEKDWSSAPIIDTFLSILRSTLTNVTSWLPGKKNENIEKYEPKETKLYVGNLPYSMESVQLLNLFSKAGTVKSAKVFKESETGRSTSFAYVVMSTQEEAIRAMYLFHRRNFDGRSLAVKIGEKEQEDDTDDSSSNPLVFEKRRLRVFLCHAHKDAVAVQAIYKRLIGNHVDAWLDKEKLLPGSDWEHEIREAVGASDIVIVCLSKGFDQRGFRQKEVRIALEESALQPEGEIFIIPARLEECEVLPSLRHLHWVNLFESDGYEKLRRTLKVRAQKIGAVL